MAQDLYDIEKQTTDLSVETFSKPKAVSQDVIKSDISLDPRFIAFIVLISSALLFVASLYYGIINP